VVDLDLAGGLARVEPDDGSTYTVPRTDRHVRLLRVDAQRAVGGATLRIGDAEVQTTVVGYQRKDAAGGGVVATEPLDLPTQVLATRAIWYVVDDAGLAVAKLDRSRVPGALHAIEHAAIGILPLFAICDRWDVGGLSTAVHPDTGAATIVIYDDTPGGAGVAELGYEAADRHLAATAESIEACRCQEGCPSCVQSPKCGNGNEHLDKDAARQLLAAVLSPPRSRDLACARPGTSPADSADRRSAAACTAWCCRARSLVQALRPVASRPARGTPIRARGRRATEAPRTARLAAATPALPTPP
jgi:DEAD/DEAH box helicase domain-containing protein